MNDQKVELERVSSVTTEKGRVFVHTQNTRPGVDSNGIEFVSPMSFIMQTPEQGDIVEIYKLGTGSKYARFPHNSLIDQDSTITMPDLGEREFAMVFDDGTRLSFRSNADTGGYDIDLNASNQVSVDASGPVTVNADSVTVNAANSVDIDGSNINLGTDSVPLVTDVSSSDASLTVSKTSKLEGE